MEQNQQETATTKMILMPMNGIQIAKLYGIGMKTFKKWIDPHLYEIGEKRGRFYTVKQVKIIMDKFGIPGTNLKM